MYVIVSEHFGLITMIRNSNKEHHEDCMNEERPEQVWVVFWGAIAYGVPCKDLSFEVWLAACQFDCSFVVSLMTFCGWRKCVSIREELDKS